MRTLISLFIPLLLCIHPAGAKDKFLAPVGTSTKAVTSADNVETLANSSGAVAVGNAVYLASAGTVAKASATTLVQPAMGLVLELVDATHCIILIRGVFTGFSAGMTAGTYYYLAETAGTLQTSPVLASGKLAQQLGYAVSATDLMVEIQDMHLQGTAAGKIVSVGPDGYLPTLDGRNLTNLPGGGGGVGGSTGATDNVLLRSDGTGGATLQTSTLICDDSGNVSGAGNISLSGTVDGVDVSALSASLGTASTHAASDFQTADADLSALAGLTSAADKVPYFTGSGTAALFTATTAGRALVGAADAAAERTAMGLGTIATEASSSYQAADATLTAFSGGTCSSDTLLYCSGSDTVTSMAFTAAGRALLDDVDASAQRTTLGLGTAATSASSAFQASDTELTALAGLTSAADSVPYFTGSGSAALFTATTGGRALAGLSWSAGTQVPSLTAAGTAGMLTVGTAASNLVQLNSGANYPTGGLNTCAWTKSWAATDGALVATGGFTLTNLSEAAATTDTAGATYIAVSSTAAVGKITWASNLPTNTSSWEVEIDWAPNVTSPFTQDGSNGISVDPGNTGVRERLIISTNFVNTSSVAWGSTLKTNSQYRQTWTMVRHASSFSYAYLNSIPIGIQPFSNASTGVTNEWCFVNCGITATTRVSRIYAIRIKAAGVCAYPPNLRNYGVITGQ